MSSYRQALKADRTEHIHKLIDNNQNNPRFLFSTVARLTNNQTSPDLNIPSQFNSRAIPPKGCHLLPKLFRKKNHFLSFLKTESSNTHI